MERDRGCAEDDRATFGRALPAGTPVQGVGWESPLVVVVTGGAGELEREGRISGRAFRACILIGDFLCCSFRLQDAADYAIRRRSSFS